MIRLLVLFLFFSFSVSADYLEVSGVTVKMTAKNSLTAKQRAVTTSYHKAFGKLLTSYFPNAKSVQNKIPEKEIQDCVYDYSIDHEKFSGKVYIAQFSFRFDKDKVALMLKDHNIEIPEYKKHDEVRIAVYTQDYLESYSQLQQYPVVVFSPRRMILRIPSEEMKFLRASKISFEKVNVKIYT